MRKPRKVEQHPKAADLDQECSWVSDRGHANFSELRFQAKFAESLSCQVGLIRPAVGRSLISLALVLLYVLQEVPRSEHGQPR